MGRMAIPKMDVVRFKENDVIVASGIIEHRYLTVFDWISYIILLNRSYASRLYSIKGSFCP